MNIGRRLGAAIAAAMLLAPMAPVGLSGAWATAAPAPKMMVVTVQAGDGPHRFTVELARSAVDQERGLMFRTGLPADGGMLFAPYPAEGKRPRVATFWMKNTPSALDILFIRPDGTIAKIVAEAVPFSEQRLSSDEPVGAVLEINGGRSAELGIVVGDKVSWAAVKG